MDQSRFESCYRGRQSMVHHMAYMRMAKVLLALHALRESGLSLGGRAIFDYGFGAGTFFRYCPGDCRISGVEQDAENVAEVSKMLRERGNREVDIRTISITSWDSHPLLQQEYDFFLCSHVLEHLPDPVGFLQRIRSCVRTSGFFLGLVPINEIADNPHHVQKVDAEMIADWARKSDFSIVYYLEADELAYPFQPLFTYDFGWRHRAAQTVSLALGVPATLLGPRYWWFLSRVASRVFSLKPTQAVFLLKRA